MSDVINIIDWEGVKRLDRATFLRLAEPETSRPRVDKALDAPISRVRGAVCFQDESGGSANFGQRYYVLFGDGEVFKTAQALIGKTYRGAAAIAYFEKEPT